MLKHILGNILLITFFPATCLAGEVNVKALDKAPWLNIETANFNVLTNASEKKAIEIVQELEDFKYFLALSLGYKQENLSEKVPVIMAKNERSFTSLGLPDSYAGLFIRRDEDYTIFVRCDGFRSSSKGGSNWGRSIVLHELVHLFIANSPLDLSLVPWYSEGIAEYFSTYIKKKDKIIIGDMSILGSRFYSLFTFNRKIENIDTESLFKTTRADLNIDDTTRKNEEFLNKFYARSVAVVHYLNSDYDLMKQLSQYLNLLKLGIKVDQAFRIAFQMTFSEFDKNINNYINANLLVGMAFPLGKEGVEFPEVKYKKNNLTKQETIEFLYRKISMLTRYIGNENFVKFNDDISKLYPGLVDNLLQEQNPENTMVLMILASAYQNTNRYREAIDIYESLLVRDDIHQHVTLLNNLAWIFATVPDKEFKDPKRAIELAERAVALNRSPAYLDTLAEAYYANGSNEMAIKTIEVAISLDGDNDYLKKQLEKFMAAMESDAQVLSE